MKNCVKIIQIFLKEDYTRSLKNDDKTINKDNLRHSETYTSFANHLC